MSGEAHLMRQALGDERPARITRYLVATDGKVHEITGSRHALVEITFKRFSGPDETREAAIERAEAYRIQRIAEVKAAIGRCQENLAHLEQLMFA